MAEKIPIIPKAFFEAQLLYLRANHYDQQLRYRQAHQEYFQVATLIKDLLQQFPDVPLRDNWVEIGRLSSHRASQLMNGDNNGSSLTRYEKQEKELEELILRNQIKVNPILSWNDVCGLEAVVGHLQEAVFTSLKYKEALSDGLSIPRTILLFGPPGCGKTHLIRVLVSEAKIFALNISAATLLSKWHGESQKMIHALYKAAWNKAPSIIFIDEFDGIFGGTTDKQQGTSDASITILQMQRELQQYMDGLHSPEVNETITIAATNFPWALNHALIRRFDRILYVGPPTYQAILQLLYRLLKNIPHQLSDNQLRWLAHEFRGYTPSEVRKICQMARLNTFRPINTSINPHNYQIQVHPRSLTFQDIKTCLKVAKPLLRKKGVEGVGTLMFRDWNEDNGFPPLHYPVQPWEKPGYHPSDDPNPIVLDEGE